MSNDHNSTNVSYKTGFSNLTDKQLYSFYTSEKWNELSSNAKTQLLQETANRETAAYGNTYSVEVKLANFTGALYGTQNGQTVTLNSNMVEDGKLRGEREGKQVEIDMNDSNWKSLETVFHEVRHSWQNEVSAERIKAEEGLKETFESNNFTISDVDGKPGLQYMKGVNNFDMYRLNPTEADANIYAQNKTMSIIDGLRNEGKTDASMEAYSNYIAKNGYDAKLAEMKSKYGEDVDKQVEQVLKNFYNNTKEPVKEDIEKEVKAEMIASYEKLCSELKNNSENEANGIVTANSAVTENIANNSNNANNLNGESPSSDESACMGMLNNDTEDFNGVTHSFDESASSGILDNNAADFQGEAPSFDTTASSGILDNNAADFQGDVPSFDATASSGIQDNANNDSENGTVSGGITATDDAGTGNDNDNDSGSDSGGIDTD